MIRYNFQDGMNFNTNSNKAIHEFIEIAINGTNQIDHVIFHGLYSIWPFKQSRSSFMYVFNSF